MSEYQNEGNEQSNTGSTGGTGGATDPLYDREHPEHAAAVQRHLDSFREPGERRTAPPQGTRVFSHDATGKRQDVLPLPEPGTEEGAAQANANAQALAAYANLPDRDEHDLRDAFERGGVPPMRLAEPLQAMWDVQAEADVIEHLAAERVPSRIISSMREAYARAMLSEGGITEENIAAFKATYAPHVPAKTLDRMIRWVRAYHRDL